MPTAVFALVAIGAIVAISHRRSVGEADLREARSVVRRYLDAYRRHDGHAICAALMPSVREQIGGSADPHACARELRRRSWIAELVPSTRPSATLRSARDVGLGDGISVTLDWPDGSAVGIGMQRVGDRWLLDGDQTCVTPSCAP